MRMRAWLQSIVFVLALTGIPAPPAAAQFVRAWYTWTHPHLRQVANGVFQGDLRVYGWSFRADHASRLSATWNFDVGFLQEGPPAWGLVVNTFSTGALHYRVEAPGQRYSLFAGGGWLRVSGAPDVLVGYGLLVGADAFIELSNRWHMTGSAAWGTGWRTTTHSGQTGSLGYTEYRLTLSAPIGPSAYAQIGYRGISWSGVPSSFLCAAGCTITWNGTFIGLAFRQ